jgi:hypothetical protein
MRRLRQIKSVQIGELDSRRTEIRPWDPRSFFWLQPCDSRLMCFLCGLCPLCAPVVPPSVTACSLRPRRSQCCILRSYILYSAFPCQCQFRTLKSFFPYLASTYRLPSPRPRNSHATVWLRETTIHWPVKFLVVLRAPLGSRARRQAADGHRCPKRFWKVQRIKPDRWQRGAWAASSAIRSGGRTCINLTHTRTGGGRKPPPHLTKSPQTVTRSVPKRVALRAASTPANRLRFASNPVLFLPPGSPPSRWLVASTPPVPKLPRHRAAKKGNGSSHAGLTRKPLKCGGQISA